MPNDGSKSASLYTPEKKASNPHQRTHLLGCDMHYRKHERGKTKLRFQYENKNFMVYEVSDADNSYKLCLSVCLRVCSNSDQLNIDLDYEGYILLSGSAGYVNQDLHRIVSLRTYDKSRIAVSGHYGEAHRLKAERYMEGIT